MPFMIPLPPGVPEPKPSPFRGFPLFFAMGAFVIIIAAFFTEMIFYFSMGETLFIPRPGGR